MAKKNEIRKAVDKINKDNRDIVKGLSQEDSKDLLKETGLNGGQGMDNQEVKDMTQAMDNYQEDLSNVNLKKAVSPPASEYVKNNPLKAPEIAINEIKKINTTIPNPIPQNKDNKQFVEGRKELSEIEKEEYLKNEKTEFNKENPNTSFGDYKFDNTAYNPKGEHLIGKEDKDITSREIRQRNKAEQKLAENEQDYEKFMSFVHDYDKYNQYGGSFNYDQFTSSVDPKTIRAAAKALGVGGLARVGIATQELYNAARKELQKKADVAYQEQQAIQAEKKKAEEKLLADKENAEANADRLKAIKEWRATLSNDPKNFTRGQAEELQKILKDKFGKDITIDDIMAQQTTGTLIDVMLNELQIPKEYLIASGVMMPEGYEKSTPLEEFLNGSDKGRADYELRFAQRRDQRNRFAQSLVDLAGITSRMIAASGGAKMEPYKNDMYDKFREDMKAARARYDERMGEIRQREIDAEKEAYARIREREKAAQEQANLDRAYDYQQTQDRIKNAIAKGNLALAAEELRIKKDENSPYYKSMRDQARRSLLANYNPEDWYAIETYLESKEKNPELLKGIKKAESVVKHNSEVGGDNNPNGTSSDNNDKTGGVFDNNNNKK